MPVDSDIYKTRSVLTLAVCAAAGEGEAGQTGAHGAALRVVALPVLGVARLVQLTLILVLTHRHVQQLLTTRKSIHANILQYHRN